MDTPQEQKHEISQADQFAAEFTAAPVTDDPAHYGQPETAGHTQD